MLIQRQLWFGVSSKNYKRESQGPVKSRSQSTFLFWGLPLSRGSKWLHKKLWRALRKAAKPGGRGKLKAVGGAGLTGKGVRVSRTFDLPEARLPLREWRKTLSVKTIKPHQ